MNSIVSDILDLENEYGHSELFNGANDENAVLDKLGLLISVMRYIESGTEKTVRDKALSSITNLINAHALSPESVAFILYLESPENDFKFEEFCRLYEARSKEDSAVFRAVYYKLKYEEAYSNLHMFDKYERINEKYIARYGHEAPDVFSGRGAVYTVIVGGYDELHDPLYVDPELDYYFFTDEPEKYSSSIWKIKKLEFVVENDNTRTQRYAKMHPFVLLPDYDFTIYVDGKFTITGDLREYINIFSRGSGMLCFPHPERQTLEEEVAAIKEFRYGLDPMVRNELDEQVDAYRAEGYADDEPLVDSGCIVRSNHDKALNEVMETWWNEVLSRTARDQISLGYSCWNRRYKYDISALSIYDNKYLDYCDHNDR
ncbi:MAG: DUF616 domain-containing protein [Lachnospiraceae bacterium]|nr:DUF616 domain-containing protein [Lachnospiraceae bacterium]